MSTIANNSLQSCLGPRGQLDPSNGAATHRASIVWFRNDLRVHDNECLYAANKESMSVLPVYCFDPRDYWKSSAGLDKTNPFRSRFLIESVSDLRNNLQARGSNLVVRVGKTETVLAELAKAMGTDAIYAHREVSRDEVEVQEKIEAAMKDEGVEVNYFWGSTLYHIDDLPFKLEDMPPNYGGFKEKVKGLAIRKIFDAPDQLKAMPSCGHVETGDIPSLIDLGLKPGAKMPQYGKLAARASMVCARASMVGGETEALKMLKKFAAECQAQPPKGNKDGTHDIIYGPNFPYEISQRLAMGCLSPRYVFDELKKAATTTSISCNNNDVGVGSPDDWFMHELLWRDFFRFLIKKCSENRFPAPKKFPP